MMIPMKQQSTFLMISFCFLLQFQWYSANAHYSETIFTNFKTFKMRVKTIPYMRRIVKLALCAWTSGRGTLISLYAVYETFCSNSIFYIVTKTKFSFHIHFFSTFAFWTIIFSSKITHVLLVSTMPIIFGKF